MLNRAIQVGLLFALAVLGGCGVLGCPDNHATVEGAKRLDPEYLSQLHAYAASGQCKVTCRPPILSRLSGLGNRAPVFEVLPNGQAQIKLSVCMDQGVILLFKEVGTPNAALYVTWSQDDLKWDRALLWSASQPNHGA